MTPDQLRNEIRAQLSYLTPEQLAQVHAWLKEQFPAQSPSFRPPSETSAPEERARPELPDDFRHLLKC
ncbi:hypothetical protein SAMN05421823_10151 [Catalinimonas alkaloidigena]|uniref:Uncharacterized protein n=1 Tax=Catalinimonas alkaloidigena TaxID=1075417 RepID=A0A1G8WFI4_9BACT|nr:hypothetical protein SAMN05421823_10151 [Catalinimonas alkaloidigena]